MKKFIAISLLIIHVFNLAGYRLLFDYMENKAKVQMTAQLDNQTYSKAGLVEIKVPMHLPYSSNWKEFERYSGEMELDGTNYNYVERKLLNDTMILLCIPNEQQTKLNCVKNEYAKQMSDVQTSSTNKKQGTGSSSIIKIVTAEYSQATNDYDLSSSTLTAVNYFLHDDDNVISSFIKSPLQPPDHTV